MGLFNFLKKNKKNLETKQSDFEKQNEKNPIKRTERSSDTISNSKASNTNKNSDTLTVRVTGTNYRDKNEILSLAKLNPEYSLNKLALIKKYPKGNTVYEYVFPTYTATFEFEPTNEYDPNAIKVMVEGIHVGYVKKGSCSRIRNLINQDKIASISAKIHGGNYKDLVLYAMDFEKGEKISSTDYELEKDTSDIRVILTLILKTNKPNS